LLAFSFLAPVLSQVCYKVKPSDFSFEQKLDALESHFHI
jgi:hypothetical protein